MATKVVAVVHILASLIGFQKCLATRFECEDDPAYLSPSSGLSCAAHGQWLSSLSNGGDDFSTSSSQDCVSKWLDGTKKRNIHELCDATSSSIVECLKVYTYSEHEILDVQKHCPKACRSLDLLCGDGSNVSIPGADQTEAPSSMPTSAPHSRTGGVLVGDGSDDMTTRVNSSILHLVETNEQSLDLKRKREGSSRRILIIIGYVTASISALGIIGCTVISLWRRVKERVDERHRTRKRKRRRSRRRRDSESRRHRSRNHRSRRKDHRSTRKRHRDCIEKDIHYKDNHNSNGIGQLRIDIDHHEAGRNKPPDNTIDCVLTISLPGWCDEDLDHELPFDYDIERGVRRHDDDFRENEQFESKRTKEDGSTMFSWFGDATNSIIQPKRGSSTCRETIPDDLSLTPRTSRPTSPGRGRRTKRKLNNDY